MKPDNEPQCKGEPLCPDFEGAAHRCIWLGMRTGCCYNFHVVLESYHDQQNNKTLGKMRGKIVVGKAENTCA